MALELGLRSTRGGSAQANDMVTGGCQGFTVRSIGKRSDETFLGLEGMKQLARRQVPDQYAVVAIGPGKQFAVG